jgi:hypothetical protein
MTLAGGLDHDGNGFGLRDGAIAGPQRDVERRIHLKARRYLQRHVAFRIQCVVLRVWLRDHSDRPGPVAPASARRRKDLMAVLLLCLFVLLDGVNNPRLPAAGRSVRRESGERVVGPGDGH